MALEEETVKVVKSGDAGKAGYGGARNVSLTRKGGKADAEIKARVKEEFAEREK